MDDMAVDTVLGAVLAVGTEKAIGDEMREITALHEAQRRIPMYTDDRGAPCAVLSGDCSISKVGPSLPNLSAQRS